MRISDRYRHFIRTYLRADSALRKKKESRPEPFSYTHPRLPPDREATIGEACAGADPQDMLLPAWMPSHCWPRWTPCGRRADGSTGPFGPSSVATETGRAFEPAGRP